MSTELEMHKRDGGLFPSGNMWLEDFQSLPENCNLRVKITVKRMPKDERWMWAAATLLGDAGIGFHGKDDAMEHLCRRCNHMQFGCNRDTGVVFLVRRSIAMDGAAQKRLRKRMEYVILTEILPGVTEGDLRNRIEEMLIPATIDRRAA